VIAERHCAGCREARNLDSFSTSKRKRRRRAVAMTTAHGARAGWGATTQVISISETDKQVVMLFAWSHRNNILLLLVLVLGLLRSSFQQVGSDRKGLGTRPPCLGSSYPTSLRCWRQESWLTPQRAPPLLAPSVACLALESRAARLPIARLPLASSRQLVPGSWILSAGIKRRKYIILEGCRS